MTAYNGFPLATTAGQGLFNGASATGLIQGMAFPDPATRYALKTGIVSDLETIPMFGGIAVSALLTPISASGPRPILGQSLVRSTSLATISGFTVFDQSYNTINDPMNPVPTAGSRQSLNWYALGSRARVALAAAPNLIDLLGEQINTQVSWDFVTNRLVPYSPGYTGATITNAVWDSANGGEITFTLGAAMAGPNAGDYIDTVGIVSTGGVLPFNGSFEVISNAGTTLVVSAPAAAGQYGTYVSGGNVVGGGGALPVTILDIQQSGCMVVEDSTGLFTWDYDGAAAVVQLG